MNPLILDNYYLKEVGRLTGEVGDDVELVSTTFTKHLMLPAQIILARVLPDSSSRIKPSI